MKKQIAVFGLIVFSIGCSPRITSSGSSAKKTEPVTTPSSEPVPDVTVTGPPTPGQMLFENNCGNCHGLPSPTEHSKEQWVPIVKRMRVQARLTEDEGNQIYDYIASLAK